MGIVREKFAERRQAYRQRKEQKEKMTAFTKIFYGGLLAVVLIMIGGLLHQQLAYQDFAVVSSVERTDQGSVSYESLGDGLLCYSKDGASYCEDLDETLWNQAYEMSAPQAVTCGDYVAIGDIGSNEIRVFSTDGQEGIITTGSPIMGLAVAGQGVTAAILSGDASWYVYLYSSAGEELVAIRSDITENGYPLALAISENGELLAVSYLQVTEGTIAALLVFYDFSDADAADEEHILGSVSSDSIIPRLAFLDGTTVAAYMEEGFALYTMGDDVQQICEVDFGQEIRSLFISENYLGFVFKNVEVQTTDSTDESEASQTQTAARYHMVVYTSSGRLYMEQDFDFEYETIINTSQEIILYNDTACVIYTFRGQEKFSYTFEETILGLLPMQTTGRYILLTSDAVSLIRLTYGWSAGT